MELVFLIVVIGGVIVLFVHPKTKNSPIIKGLKAAWKNILESKEPAPPPVVVKPVQSKSTEPGNVPRVKAEVGKEPPSTNLHVFPETREPVTRFEEFNAKLFTFTPSETRRWDASLDNDFSTDLTGERAWVQEEIKKRLRPKFPVLYDPFGLWAKASINLELDPHHNDPTVIAYLQFPREKRPVIVSEVRHEASAAKKDNPKFVLYRYGFVDYEFDRKFLDDYPADLIHGLLKAFSGSDDEWESFSPARLRKDVLEANREEEEHRQAMASHQHANRFAALWQLREEETAEPDPEVEEVAAQ
tara:strand:- start:27585 stop:28487 length:903 start_codon:yes stop_codon:yes gene_type:complete